MQFADVFKLLCKEAGVTQQQALKEMGMGRNATQRWIDGMPSFNAMMKITSYFGITTDTVYACMESDDENWVRSLFVSDAIPEETKNVPATNDRHVTDEDIKFALFGGSGEVTDAMYEEVKSFAAYIKSRGVKEAQ